MASNITSEVVSTKNLDKASIHVSWTGSSPVGTLTVQARNGENDSYRTLDFGSAISVSGNSGEHELIFTELPFSDIKMTYTRTSGTGTMSAYIHSKVVGA